MKVDTVPAVAETVPPVIKTVPAVIEALGGRRSVAKFTGRSLQQLSNWKNAGEFPAKYFVMMTTALARKGKDAPVRLWGQVGQVVVKKKVAIKKKRRNQGVRRHNGCQPKKKKAPPA